MRKPVRGALQGCPLRRPGCFSALLCFLGGPGCVSSRVGGVEPNRSHSDTAVSFPSQLVTSDLLIVLDTVTNGD